MQTTKFNIQLGNSLKFKEGFFEIYAIGENAVSKKETIPVHSNTFSVDLDNSANIYYAIILTITKSNIKNYSQEKPIQLLSIFNGANADVFLNEQLTIANTFCYAQFMQVSEDQSVHIWGNTRSIEVAHLMRLNFMDDVGKLSSVIATSPNALETNSYCMWNSLSNLLYYCLNNTTTYQSFLEQTSTPNKPATSFLQGLSSLVHNPFNNVQAIYELVCSEEQPYTPSLPQIIPVGEKTQVVSQWTLSIKVHDSGAQNFLIGGPAYVVFDKNDRAWITNNVTQGTPNSSTFCTILEPDGSPASFSPLFGGGLLGSGFGIATDKNKENIYIGNYGWGPTQCNPQEGSLSVFSCEGNSISPPQGYTNSLHRIQGINFDSKGNLWMCSWGTQDPLAPSDASYYNFESHDSSIVVYLGGDPNRAVSYNFGEMASPHNLTFSVTFDKDDNAIVSNAGSDSKDLSKCQISTIYKLELKDGAIRPLASWSDADNPKTNGYEGFRQVTINSKGEIYIAAIQSNRIIKFDKDLNFIRDFTENIHLPWGVIIDNKDTLWVSNFGKERAIGEGDLGIGVTIIKETETDDINNFMTLPSGGKEVLLKNGFPLYGNIWSDPTTDKPQLHCFSPLMRLTSSSIDRCGNLWAVNNWKPSAYMDIKENPGGDGIVIFIGVATPML
jgi:hypothetical protein